MSTVESQAIVTYIGVGQATYPDLSRARVESAFPQRPDLVAYAEGIVHELGEVAPDWSVDTVESARERAVRMVGERHPELGPDALDALRWEFDFAWR